MKIGFIGCGNMASAMISGMLKKRTFIKKMRLLFPILQKRGSKRSREKAGSGYNPG